MLVPDPRRPSSLKLVNRILYTESLPFDKVADDQEPGSIKAIVTVYPDQRAWKLAVTMLLHPICYLVL